MTTTINKKPLILQKNLSIKDVKYLINNIEDNVNYKQLFQNVGKKPITLSSILYKFIRKIKNIINLNAMLQFLGDDDIIRMLKMNLGRDILDWSVNLNSS